MAPRSGVKKQVLLVQNPDSDSDSDEAKPMCPTVYSNHAASTSSRLLDSLVILTPVSPIHAGHLPYSDYSSARSSPTPPPITPAQTFPALNGFYHHPGVSNSRTNGFGEPVHTWNSHIDGHIRRPSDTQRQVSSPTTEAPVPPKGVVKALASTDTDTWITVELTGAQNAAYIRERIFSKLNIQDDEHAHQLIYRVDGESKGEPLSDADIMRNYQVHGDSASSLRFLVKQSKPRLPPDGRLLPPVPTTTTAPYPPSLDPGSRAVEGLPPLSRTREEDPYDASVSDDGERAPRRKQMPTMPPPPQGPPPRPPASLNDNNRRHNATTPILRHTNVTPTPSLQGPPPSKSYPPDYKFSTAAEPQYAPPPPPPPPPDNRYPPRNETAPPQPLYPPYPDDRDFRPKASTSHSYQERPKAPAAPVEEYSVYRTVSSEPTSRRPRVDSPNQNGYPSNSMLPYSGVRASGPLPRTSNGPRSPHTANTKPNKHPPTRGLAPPLRMPSRDGSRGTGQQRIDGSFFLRGQYAQGDSPRNNVINANASGAFRNIHQPQQQPPPSQMTTSPDGGRGLHTSRSVDGALRQQFAEHAQRNTVPSASSGGAGGGATIQTGPGSSRYSPITTRRPQPVYGGPVNGYRALDPPSAGDGMYSPRSPTGIRRQDHVQRSPREPPLSLQPGRGASSLYPAAVVPSLTCSTMAIPIASSNNNYSISPPYASDLSVYNPSYNVSPHLPPVQSSSLPRALERPSPMSLGAVVRSPVQSSPRQPIQSHWPGDNDYPPPSPSLSSPLRGLRVLPTPGGVTNSPQRHANVDLYRLNGERDREQKPQEETRRHAIPESPPLVPPRQESLTAVGEQYGRMIEKGANGGTSPTRRDASVSPAGVEDDPHTDGEGSNEGTVRAEERNRLQAARKLEGLSVDGTGVGIGNTSNPTLASGPLSGFGSNEATLIVPGSHSSKSKPLQSYETDENSTAIPSTYESNIKRGDPWNDEEDEASQFSDGDGTMNSLWQTPLVKRFSMMVRGPRPPLLNTTLAAAPGLETIPSSADTMTPRGLDNKNGVPNAGVMFDFRNFRPAVEDVYNRLDKFFPDHDLDKPVADSVGTSEGNSPIITEQAPLSSYIAPLPSDAKQPERVSTDDERWIGVDRGLAHFRRRSGHKKSMRTVAGERKKAMDRTSKLGPDDAASTVLRKRSTKFWGNKMKEIPPDVYQRLGGASTGRAAGAPDSPIRAPDSPNAAPVSIKDSLSAGVVPWVRGKLIGKGTYGKVYLAFDVNTGEVFAVKRVEMPESASDRTDPKQKLVLEALKAESKTLQDLDHSHVVQYLGFEQTSKYFSIFLEYVPGGSIGECLRKLERGFDDDLTRHCTSQIVYGLAYLHSRNILHRDLKADNILVNLEGVCKISDFGISKHGSDIYANNDNATSMQGTVFWMAPEVISSPDGYGGKADVWSIACIVLEMWTGLRPWHGTPQIAVILMLGQASSRKAPPLSSNVKTTPEGMDFINQCFALEPKERPTAEELKKHPYLMTRAGWTFTPGTIPGGRVNNRPPGQS